MAEDGRRASGQDERAGWTGWARRDVSSRRRQVVIGGGDKAGRGGEEGRSTGTGLRRRRRSRADDCAVRGRARRQQQHTSSTARDPGLCVTALLQQQQGWGPLALARQPARHRPRLARCSDSPAATTSFRTAALLALHPLPRCPLCSVAVAAFEICAPLSAVPAAAAIAAALLAVAALTSSGPPSPSHPAPASTPARLASHVVATVGLYCRACSRLALPRC